MNVMFSATDFIYAVVVGAAFQRITTPDLSLNNVLLVVAFAVVIDDWVLYHAQAANLERSVESPMRLVLDMVILLIWYWAAIAAAQGATGFARFAFLTSIFYLATAFWEAMFYKQTKSKIRLSMDVLCAAYVGILALLVWRGVVPSGSSWSVAAFVPVILFRVPVWQRVLGTLSKTA